MAFSKRDEILVKKWLKAAKVGDKKAFEKVVLKLQNAIFSHCWRILNNYQDAADAVQETFVKVYFRLEKFDFKKRPLPWIFKIATNTCLDSLRKVKRFLSLDAIENAEDFLEAKDSKEEDFVEKEKVIKAMEKLPKKLKAAVSLFYFEGYKYKEIAEMMGTSIGNVKSWIFRGKRKLKCLMTNV